MKPDWAEALKELLEQYDTYRQRWVEKYGSDKGYGVWFRDQVTRGDIAPVDGFTPGEVRETVAERAAGMAETFGPVITV